jgi:hypothetical protein
MARERRARLGYIPSPLGPAAHPVRVWVEAGAVFFRVQYSTKAAKSVPLVDIYRDILAKEYLPGCAPCAQAADSKNSLPPLPLGPAKAGAEGVGASDGASRAIKVSAREKRVTKSKHKTKHKKAAK